MIKSKCLLLTLSLLAAAVCVAGGALIYDEWRAQAIHGLGNYFSPRALEALVTVAVAAGSLAYTVFLAHAAGFTHGRAAATVAEGGARTIQAVPPSDIETLTRPAALSPAASNLESGDFTTFRSPPVPAA